MSAAKSPATDPSTRAAASPPREPPKLVETRSDYAELELANDMTTPDPVDRKGQVVRVFRAKNGIRLMEHPAGVEVAGEHARWTGVVPWSSIKVAKR